MSKFELSSTVGSYENLPRLDVRIEIEDVVSEEDYKIIRDAIESLENIVSSYPARAKAVDEVD